MSRCTCLPVRFSGNPFASRTNLEKVDSLYPERPDDGTLRQLDARQQAAECLRVVLCDDHNHELGLMALRSVIKRVAEQQGSAGVGAVTFELTLRLAQVIEHIAAEHGLTALDVADIWFADR